MTGPLGVPKVEIYAVSTISGAGWHDITARVRRSSDGKTAVRIQHGNHGNSGGIPEPSQCWMTWDVRDGELWPRNPMSQFAGSLGLNTPLRVPLEMVDHTFASTVVNGWAPVGGYTVVNTGSGGTVAASDFQQPGGTATHSVPVASAYRQSVLDGWDMEDCEQAIDFQLPFSDTTGGAVEPANLIFRYIDGVSHYLLRVVVNTDETISMKWIQVQIGVGEFDLTDVHTASITHSGQWLRVKGNLEGNRLQAKIWDPDDLEPLEWVIDEAPVSDDRDLVTGDIGVRTGVASGNTNTKPIVVSYRDWMIRSIRFHGEVAEYPLEIETSGNDLTIPIVASGVTRRLAEDLPVLSALRRAIPLQAGLQAYWPLEDPRGSNSFASALSGHPPMIPLTGTPGYAEYSDLPSSQALPTGNGSDWRGLVPDYTDTGNIQVSFVLQLPAGDQPDRTILCRWYTEHGSAKLWQLIYRTPGGDLQLQAWNSENAFVYESAVQNFDLNDTAVLVSVQLSNSGADVDWEIRALDMIDGGTSVGSGTATGLQLASVKRVWMNLTFADTPAYGHVIVQSVLTDYFELGTESQAHDGESNGLRLARLLDENGIECTRERSFNSLSILSMGPQEPADLPTLLEECVTLDSGGKWFDGRSHAGVMYRERTALGGQDPWVTLSYADRHLSPPWAPRIDPRDIQNKVTVTRKGGSSATFELASGPKSTLPPGQGGVGIYSGGDVTVNAEDDSLLQQIAARRVAIGTVDEPRYTTAATNLARPELLASPEIGRRLLDLRRGRVFEVADAAAVYQFDSAFQLVDGYTEEITDFIHTFEINGVPVGPYNVFELEHAERGLLDTAHASLENGINATQTTFTVQATDEGCLWTEDPSWFPFDIKVGGERMTVTDIDTVTPTFISVGTAAHADNATVAPGAPAGAQAGDLLIALGATRDLASTPTVSDSDYTLLLDVVSLKLWGRIWDGVEAMPTIGTSGGGAGSTVTGMIAAFRNVSLTARDTAVFGNGSAQNMLVPGIYKLMSKSLALIVAQKQDDWTSVAPLTGATEIADVSSTVGSDQGVVWDYQAFTGLVSTPEQNFVVTGGASANSRTGVLVLGNWQTFTVTRSVNGVVKPHAAGTEVHIFEDPRYSL